ncbi:MAG: hypothetical protein ABSH22_14745, partial [Tepidisphaeraceae bacterium]
NAGSGKRNNARAGVRKYVTIKPLTPRNAPPVPSVQVLVRDLSAEGIGLIHHETLPTNSLFAIRLPIYGTRLITAIYIVKHCDELEKDLYRIGAALLKIDDPEGALTVSLGPAASMAPAPAGAVAISSDAGAAEGSAGTATAVAPVVAAPSTPTPSPAQTPAAAEPPAEADQLGGGGF